MQKKSRIISSVPQSWVVKLENVDGEEKKGDGQMIVYWTDGRGHEMTDDKAYVCYLVFVNINCGNVIRVSRQRTHATETI